jgi:segregation and condensation protein B
MPPKSTPSQDQADELGLGQFAAPDDAGFSLEQLGRDLAGDDDPRAVPYREAEGEPAHQPASDAAEAASAPLPTAAQVEKLVAEEAFDERCDLSPRSILEAMLFTGHPSNEPLTSEQVAALMRGVRPPEIDELVRELNEQYAAEGAAYTIASEGAGYRLALHDQFAHLRDKFYGRVKEAKLSQAAIDTLAVVAYHPDITAEEVDRLRGKPSGAILSQLVRRQLLSLERTKEKPRRTLYRTTARFLELFGLGGLDELPRAQDLE